MYPVDTVKTHMQASPTRLGVSEAVRQVLATQGARGLMRGATVIGAGCVPAHAGFFGSYELAVARFAAKDDARRPVQMAACGGIATTVHDVILTPHDVVKQRLQLGRHVGGWECAAAVWRQEGVWGFYRSLPVALAMNIPYTGVLVATNDWLRQVLRVEERMEGPGGLMAAAPWHFLCAGVGGIVAGVLTTPLDVLKTRLQTRHPGCEGGAFACLSATVREQGLRGLFRGGLPRMVLAAPSAAVSWGTYETVRGFIQQVASERAVLEEAVPQQASLLLNRASSE